MPQDQASNDTWGVKINADLQAIDSQVWSATQVWTGVANYNPLLTPHNINLQTDASNSATVSFFNSLAGAGERLRWQLGADNAPETGGNAGSNFGLFNYDDNGVKIGEPIAVNRATGSVSLGTSGSTITFNGTASFQQSLTSAGPFNCGSPLTLAPDSTGQTASIIFPSTVIPDITTGGDTVSWGNILASENRFTIFGPGMNFDLTHLDTNAAFITFQHSGGLSAGSIALSPGLFIGVAAAPTDKALYASPGGLAWCSGPGTAQIFAGLSCTQNTSNPNQASITLQAGGGGFSTSLATDFSGNFIYSGAGNALKAGGGPWGAVSDARIKTVSGEYDLGLDAVTALRPVRYRYRGNDAEPGKQGLPSDRELVGLVAQEVEAIMPGMVVKGEGYIDGEKVSDMRTLDTSELLFALVNCVKELKAEIEALKAER